MFMGGGQFGTIIVDLLHEDWGSCSDEGLGKEDSVRNSGKIRGTKGKWVKAKEGGTGSQTFLSPVL